MSEHLYTSYSGYKIDRFSYTQAAAIEKCGHAFDLERIRGWAKKKDGASLRFGEAIETSVRDFYGTDPRDPMDHFCELWDKYKEFDLEYRKNDQDWDHLLEVGRCLMKAWREGKTSRGYYRDLFDGDSKFAVSLELLNWCDWTALEYTADSLHPSRVVDMKTSSKSYPEDPESTAMDHQLRTGCLVTGFRKTAFLVFVKTKTPSIQYLPAEVRDEWVDDIDQWLRAQRGKVLRREFHRSGGVRFPNQACSMCDVRAACIGDVAGMAELHQRTGKNPVNLDFLDKI